MSSVKIILRLRSKKDGTHPLILKVIKNRRPSIITLGQSIKKEDWDANTGKVKKSHPNFKRLNHLLLTKLKEASDTLLKTDTDNATQSAQAITQTINQQGRSTFFPQASDYLEVLKKSGKYNQYTADKPRVSHFQTFCKNKDISFNELTVELLKNYKAFLKNATPGTFKDKRKEKIAKVTKPEKHKRYYKPAKTKKMGERTIVNHLVTIRSVFAYARDKNIVDNKLSPFGKGKIQIKFPKSIKIGLDQNEIKDLENVEPHEAYHNHCRNLWLTSFYFAGMRVSDLLRLKWSDFKNNRLYYSMGKNEKLLSLKVPGKASAILEKYKQFQENEDDLIFPELKGVNQDDAFALKRSIAFKTSAIDKCLRKHVAPKAGITKKLTMHIARHSFAQNAKHIDIRTLQQLFRHSKLETTEGYMGDFIHNDADDALDSVLAYEPRQVCTTPHLLIASLSNFVAHAPVLITVISVIRCLNC